MQKAQTLKGFRDFLPEDMAIRNKVISTLKKVFESYGFSELQTPTLEYAQILLGKYGEEAEKLMYLFKDNGEREVGMKYDLTVPLARVAASYPDLPKPFKRYQIQPVFRADNPQKGRYREIYQCDIDTVGTMSLGADAEIISIISDVLRELRFESFTIRVNSREVLFGLIDKAGISKELATSVIQSIDKLDKKTQEEIDLELAKKSLTREQINALFAAIKNASPNTELKRVIEEAQRLGAQNITFDPTLARGLDYYTGAIFETVVTQPKIGSITGGGRYDNLIGSLGGPDLPAVGTTFGLDRICDVIKDLNLWPDLPPTPTKVLVTTFSKELAKKSLELATKLRKAGVPTELYLDSSEKLDKQLRYADKKGVPYAIIIGPEEVEKKIINLKNLSSKSSRLIGTDNLIKELKEELKND